MDPRAPSPQRRSDHGALSLTRLGRLAVIVLGCAIAALLGTLAVWAWRTVLDPGVSGSQGMVACGETLLFLLVFALAGTLPTALAVRALRGVPWIWTALRTIAIAAATMSLLAAAVYCTSRPGLSGVPWAGWSGPAVLVLLLSPLTALALGLLGWLAPDPRSRRTLLWCAGSTVFAASAFVFDLLVLRGR